ncbi:MAG: hypothetical protein ACRDQX_16600, partial [Pseudonocardiaceae bacterium]
PIASTTMTVPPRPVASTTTTVTSPPNAVAPITRVTLPPIPAATTTTNPCTGACADAQLRIQDDRSAVTSAEWTLENDTTTANTHATWCSEAQWQVQQDLGDNASSALVSHDQQFAHDTCEQAQEDANAAQQDKTNLQAAENQLQQDYAAGAR